MTVEISVTKCWVVVVEGDSGKWEWIDVKVAFCVIYSLSVCWD